MIDRRRPADRRQHEDRREHSRQAFASRIRFLRAGSRDGTALRGRLLDASAAGVRLLLDDPVAVSERLLIEARDQRNRCCNLTAQVVWSEKTEDGRFRVGCELLVELTDRQLKVLQDFALAD